MHALHIIFKEDEGDEERYTKIVCFWLGLRFLFLLSSIGIVWIMGWPWSEDPPRPGSPPAWPPSTTTCCWSMLIIVIRGLKEGTLFKKVNQVSYSNKITCRCLYLEKSKCIGCLKDYWAVILHDFYYSLHCYLDLDSLWNFIEKKLND